MMASQSEEGAPLEPASSDASGAAVDLFKAPSIPVAKALIVAIVFAFLAGAFAWRIANGLRAAEIVDLDDFYGGSALSVPIATRNGAVAYAILGAILSFYLGASAGLLIGRRSIARLVAAGLAGTLLGAVAGAASAQVLMPIYLGDLEKADLTRSILIHLGIWSAVGAAAGAAFGIGSGNRGVFLRSLVGGITGAALAVLLFDMVGVFFPLAHTERPLSQEDGTRLAANLVLALCVAVGVVVVASQEPRSGAARSA